MKKNTWLFLVLCLPVIGLSQGVKTNGFDKFLKKQRLEMEPVVVTGLPEKDRLSLTYTAISSDLFLSLSGTGWGAATVDKENNLIISFTNDSSVTLKATSLQSFEPGLLAHSYRHLYNLNFQQLSALSRFEIANLRKYSFDTYSDLSIPEENRSQLKNRSSLFLAELKKANIDDAVKQISVKDIRDHIGDSVTFCSKVFRTRYFKDSEEGPTVLDVQADFSDPFVNVVILQKDRAAFGNTPEVNFLNKEVCISGVVRLRNNIPYVAVQGPAQIRLQEAETQPTAKQTEAVATVAPTETTVETLAQYPGGPAAFLTYLEQNFAAVSSGKNSRQVILTFVIDAQGNCGGIKILESNDNQLTQRIKNVLLKMPKWKPAFSNGRFVATRITQPITIKGV